MDLAYLDPGSGSQLAMAVVAGFAGTMVAVKLWWRRALSAVRRLGRRQPSGSTGPGTADRDD